MTRLLFHGIPLESVAELVHIQGSKKNLNSNLPIKQLAVKVCLLWASQVAAFCHLVGTGHTRALVHMHQAGENTLTLY